MVRLMQSCSSAQKDWRFYMARTKKNQVVEDVVVSPINAAACKDFASIAFDKNSKLYGISKTGALYRYDWEQKGWVKV
jgi:hypothetical protein